MQPQLLRVRAYYNEFEPFAAHWLRELIREGLIPEGDVDDRSITDVEPADLKDYTQCHFFAGIGGWAYATRLARWPDSRPIWTGSPPCQPFSAAGKRLGTDDERHLWPVWFDLVRECRPPTIFGEQVSAAVRHGWLDQLQADLEDSDYAVGSVIIPASGVGALHRRERLWFVAHADFQRWKGFSGKREAGVTEHCKASSLAVTNSSDGRAVKESEQPQGDSRRKPDGDSSIIRTVAYPNDLRHERGQETGLEAERRSEYTGKHSLANGDNAGQRSDGGPVQQNQWHNLWGRCEAVRCKDGKTRLIPTEPEIFPLAHGIPNRVGTLRGAGNAIVPQVAAEILKIFT